MLATANSRAALRPYLASMGIFLPLAAIGCAWYIEKQDIDWRLASGMLVALLIEAALYLGAASPGVRERMAASGPVRMGCLLGGATALTWLLAGGGTVWQGAAAIGVGSALAFWYVVMPRSGIGDVLLVTFFGVLVLGEVGKILYPMPWHRAPGPLVGELAWTRTLLYSVLVARRAEGIGFGLFPDAGEWRIGIRNYLIFVVLAGPVGWWIGFARPRELPADVGRLALSLIGTFLGMYLYVALREEVLFRGLLQQRFGEWTGSPLWGLAVTSVIFGLAHLPFGEFPNWRFAVMAGLAGIAYGQAYLATGSVRAAMVTHGLVATTWRVFLVS